MDTELLRHRVAEIQQEQRIAQEMYDSLYRAKLLSGPELEDHYRRLLYEVRGLIDYFRAMADAVENLSSNAEQVIIQIGRMLQDSLDGNSARTAFLLD